LSLLTAVAATAILAVAPAQGAVSGVVVNGSDGLSPHTDGLVSTLGVGWVRLFVSWSVFEPSKGKIEQSQVAALESGIAGLPKGTKVIIDVVHSPQWASGSTDQAAPPRDPADYAAFVETMARRLAGKVAAWEVWNEEDAPIWWTGAPDAPAYAALLKAAYPAIKTADAHATVVLGGLTGNDYEYLDQLYANGVKGYFDALSVHTDTICDVISPYEYIRNDPTAPYAGHINRWAFLGYRTVHEVMLAHGDQSPIWMTEMGWSTYPGICNSGRWAGQKPGGVAPAQQATFLLQAFHCLAQDAYVQIAIWYGMQDMPPFDNPRGEYGLLSSSLNPKPAFGALSEYAHNGDRLSEPCGNFSGPAIKVSKPLAGAHYKNTLPIVVSASDPYGVHQISLYHDGQIIRNFTSKPPVTNLTGSMTWYGARLIGTGKHVLTITAIDVKGNTSSTSVVVYHGAERKAHRKHRRHKRHKRHRRRRHH
jgi:Cellulase (glycosyl hydrolase family 5)